MTNPLITPPTLPFNVPAFDKIDNEHLLPAIKKGIQKTQEHIDFIKNNTEDPDFKNTIVALEHSSGEMEISSSVMGIYYITNMTDEMQAIYEEAQKLMNDFSNKMMADEALFDRIKAVYNKKNELNLDQEDSILLEETYKSFVRNGANLNKEDKEALREIDNKMISVVNKFNSNSTKDINEFVHFIEDESDLRGISPHVVQSMAKLAESKDKKGQWAATIQPAVYQDVLSYAENRELRKTLFLGMQDVARHGDRDNFPNIKEILSLKNKRTKLLGYKDYPSYVLEKRILNETSKVKSFLETLHSKIRPHYETDLKTLTDYAKQKDSIEKLEAWDIGYYSVKYKSEKLSYDPQEVQKYLPADKVLEGFFDHCEKLFQIKFEKSNDIPVYHEDVEVFTVLDQKTNKPLGVLYGDFYYRENKRPHAWMSTVTLHHIKADGSEQLPIVTINQSSLKSDDPSKPALMSLNDVETLFHEGGHGLHGLLSQKPKYESLAGTNVKWDFVELPSQVQENWVLEKEVLQSFAKHHETGDTIPDELFKKIKQSRQLMTSLHLYRQNFFGNMDIAWHTQITGDESVEEIKAFETKLAQKYFTSGERDQACMSQTFSHIFGGGYSCGYYSYAYAEVLDADAFEAFKEKGDLYHAETAKKLRDILDAGATNDPVALYQDFRGRDPDPDAMLKRAGLVK